MSGNFVQRGKPAIVDKFARSRCAIAAGADAVLELPTIYALSAAQNFAEGAVKILKELGCTHLAIGATHTNLDDYYALAKIKNQNMKKSLQAGLDKGLSYSSALINVLKTKYPNCEKIFKDASNVLALEYIEQVVAQKANFKILLIERTDGGYNSKTVVNNFANASTIRKFINQKDIVKSKKYIPAYTDWQLENLPNTDVIDSIEFYNLRNKTVQTSTNTIQTDTGVPVQPKAAWSNTIIQLIA